MKHKFLIMAGGTGGHVFPALAVARELIARGHDIEWLGTDRGIESRLVPEAGILLHKIPIEGVRGRGLIGLLKAPFLIVKAVLASRGIIKNSGVDAVIGFGGFASGPGALAAKLLGKPVITHEQNAIAGTTNKLSARFATKILMAFDGAYSKPEFASRAQIVGNPVRREIIDVLPPKQRVTVRETQALRLLVVGGSLGALALNRLIPHAIAKLNDHCVVKVLHQTGQAHHDATRTLYQELGVEAEVVPFITDMARAYTQCDLVICRAGALTVSELMAVGIGAVLIPLPNAIDDHQTANAKILENAGAGIVMAQSELTAEQLAHLLQQHFFINSAEVNQSKLIAMGEAARALAIPQSAQLVANACEEAARG